MKFDRSVIAVCLAALFIFIYASNASAQSQGRTVRLLSGKQIKLLAVGPTGFGDGEKKACMLKYETNFDLGDKANLCKEADDLWDGVCKEVDNAGFTVAIISAIPKTPNSAKFFNFLFQKDAEGNWKCPDITRLPARVVYKEALCWIA
jgi:hypothetical protein